VIREWHCGADWSIHNSPYFTWIDPGDIGSGIISYEASIDNQAPIDIGKMELYHPTWLSGEHTFKIRAVDAVGQRSEWSNVITVRIDLDPPPAPTITSPTHPDQEKWYPDDSPGFSWNVPEDLSGIDGYYYLLDRTIDSIPTVISYWTKETAYLSPPLNDGIWYFHIVAKDGVGHLGTEPAHYRVKIDKTPPITIDDFVDEEWHNEDIAINLTAFDISSGVANTYYRINEEDIKDVAVDGQPVITTEGADNTLEYWSVDNAGNGEVHYKITGIKLDNTAPVVEIISPAGGDVYIAKKDIITIDFRVSDNLDPSPKVTSYLKDVEEETIVNVVNGQKMDLLSIDDGFWTFTVEAKDWVGNTTSVTTEKFKVIHDIQPPRTSITVGEPRYGTAPTYVTSSTPFTLTAVDDMIEVGDGIGLGVDYIDYKIDQEDWKRYTSPFTIPDEGEHTISYRSVDVIGIVEEVKSLSVCVDNASPITGDDFEDDKWYNKDITVTLTATDNLSGVSKTYYRINDKQFTGNRITITEDGIYRVEYWSVDNLGNIEEHHLIPQIRLDKTPPIANAGSDQVTDEGTEVTFDGSNSSDNLSGIVSYGWDLNDPTTVEGVKVKHTYGDNGGFTVTLTVYDAAGNSATDTAIVTVRNVPPKVDVGDDKVVDENSAVIFEGSFSDPGWLDTHTATWDFGDGTGKEGIIMEENDPPDATGKVLADRTYEWLGVYNVTLKVVDDDEGVGEGALVVTVQDAAPPNAELIFPSPENKGLCLIISGKTSIMGLANDIHFEGTHSAAPTPNNFGWYQLSYAAGKDGVSGWINITDKIFTPLIEPGILAVWDTTDILPGYYTLRLVASEVIKPDKTTKPNVSTTTANVYIGQPEVLFSFGQDLLNKSSYLALTNVPDDNGLDTVKLPDGEGSFQEIELEDGENILCVTDTNNDRIVAYKTDGTLEGTTYLTDIITKEGQAQGKGRGTEDKDPNKPKGIFFKLTQVEGLEHHYDLSIYFADRNNDQVLKIMPKEVIKIGTNLGFNKPTGLALDSKDNLYITDRNNDRLLKLTKDGVLDEVFSFLVAEFIGLNKPSGLAVDSDDNLYVADTNNDRILKFDFESGQLLTISGSLNKPTGVVVDERGYIYVSDTNNSVIKKFNPYGNLVAEFILELNKPVGLVLDSTGRLVIVDRNSDKLMLIGLP